MKRVPTGQKFCNNALGQINHLYVFSGTSRYWFVAILSYGYVYYVIYFSRGYVSNYAAEKLMRKKEDFIFYGQLISCIHHLEIMLGLIVPYNVQVTVYIFMQ